ncbi:MAG: glycyl-radical enzyme activating protein [Oscillospiraceae bacterium]|jgi:pyruvate formate lyase activating enzyme|nr:glycyl-radical enzyme activating protein [Oscillospiraceae bacterium]
MQASKEPQGMVFDIQRYCVHDGPGIRTTVFLKGCNLRCFWCHNPESYRAGQDLMFYPNKCIGCGKCFALCPLGCHSTDGAGKHLIDREKCTVCGVCARRCFAGALTLSGKTRGVADVMKTVRADAAFYRNSGGGMTVSGGEPMLQPEFTAALLRTAHEEQIHTALDTAGNVEYAAYEALLPFVSLILFDLKCMDSTRHKEVTGVGNERILANLRRLGEGKTPIWVRIPVIPGVNDNAASMQLAAALTRGLSAVEKVELLPYHGLGSGKREALGLAYDHRGMEAPSKEALEELETYFL